MGVLIAMTRLKVNGTLLTILVSSGTLRTTTVVLGRLRLSCVVLVQTNGRLTVLSCLCVFGVVPVLKIRLVTYGWPTALLVSNVLGLNLVMTRGSVIFLGLMTRRVSVLQLTRNVLSRPSCVVIASPFVVTLLASFTCTTAFTTVGVFSGWPLLIVFSREGSWSVQ